MSKAKNVPLKPTYTPPSLVVWTDERLAALDKTQLANLLENLQTQLTSGRVSEATAVDLEVRIKSRLPTPKAAPRRKRPRSEIRAEARAAEQLGDLAAELARRYDLSAESAVKASAGTKGFRAEHARTGASVRGGMAAVERYVGYRRGDSFAGLAFVLLSDDSERPVYVLLGTDDLMGDEAADNEYTPLAGQHGWSATSRARMRAQAMSGFDEGAQRYEELLAQLVSGQQ
jgi:hypothetical protein